jgi:hypothetical protein
MLNPTVVWYLIGALAILCVLYVIMPIIQALVKNKVLPPPDEMQKTIAERLAQLQVIFEIAIQVVRYLEQMGKLKRLTNEEKKSQAKLLVKQLVSELKLDLPFDVDKQIDIAIEAAVNLMNSEKAVELPIPVVNVTPEIKEVRVFTSAPIPIIPVEAEPKG